MLQTWFKVEQNKTKTFTNHFNFWISLLLLTYKWKCPYVNTKAITTCMLVPAWYDLLSWSLPSSAKFMRPICSNPACDLPQLITGGLSGTCKHIFVGMQYKHDHSKPGICNVCPKFCIMMLFLCLLPLFGHTMHVSTLCNTFWTWFWFIQSEVESVLESLELVWPLCEHRARLDTCSESSSIIGSKDIKVRHCHIIVPVIRVCVASLWAPKMSCSPWHSSKDVNQCEIPPQRKVAATLLQHCITPIAHWTNLCGILKYLPVLGWSLTCPSVSLSIAKLVAYSLANS